MAPVQRPLMQESTGDILKKQRATHRESFYILSLGKKFYFVPKNFYHNSKLYIFTILYFFLKLQFCTESTQVNRWRWWATRGPKWGMDQRSVESEFHLQNLEKNYNLVRKIAATALRHPHCNREKFFAFLASFPQKF